MSTDGGSRLAVGQLPAVEEGMQAGGDLLCALSWVFAFIGLTASSPEAANAFGFTILFPLTFVSSAFVPVESKPSWLQPVAEDNPFTITVNPVRRLFIDTAAGNDVWLAAIRSIAITIVFGALAIWRYRRVVVH